MNIFNFEELIADMLTVTDEQREDDDYLPSLFYDKFGIEFDRGYDFAKYLLMHTVPVEAGIDKKHYHVFVSKDKPFMIMEAEEKVI
jgi:hypothetical protein